MRIIDLIDKKAKNKELSKEEINFIVENYTNDKIADYQMSALLMAIVLNGMTDEETTFLTMSMVNSGDILDLSSIEGVVVDKHSTGGIGDKGSIVLLPIVGACGAKSLKMSGRGLGYTGGTWDKYESIPGFKCDIDPTKAIDIVNKIGIANIAVSGNLAPADKKIYALRDVTATVESIPLIASSIMSKKIATGADTILLDVKVGNGAFMKNKEDATKLAKVMVSIGKNLGKDVRVELTSMDRPLGRAIGNRNEIIESVEALKGNGYKDLNELMISSAAEMLDQAKIASGEKAIELVKEVIANGNALEKLYEMIEAQGGDINALKNPDFLKAEYVVEIKSTESGFMEIFSPIDLGIASMKMGAGRRVKTDIIDPVAGIYIGKKTNEEIKENDVLFTLSSSKEISNEIIDQVKKSYKINQHKIENKIILGKIK